MRAAAAKIATAAFAMLLAAALAGATVSAFSSSAASAGNTFATKSSFASCAGTTVANGFLTGFETGRIGYSGGLLTASGPATVDGTAGVARTGSYALKVFTSGTSGYGQHMWMTSPFPTVQVTRFAFRLNSLPTTDAQIFWNSSTGNGIGRLHYKQSTGTLGAAIKRDATSPFTNVTGTTPVSVGTWHVIEVRYSVASATHTLEWRVDGSAQPTASVAATASSVSNVQFGTQAAETLQAYYDDILISRATGDYPLGDGRVYALRPNGMGTSVNPNNFQDDDGTPIDSTSWQRLDEVPMTATNDYIQQVTGATGSYAELTLDDTTHTCIRSAYATFSVHLDGAANNLKLSVYDGATESVIRSGNMAANNTLSRNYGNPVAPATTWSQSAVNGLVARWGYAANNSDVTPIQPLDSVMVEYEVPQ